MNLLSTLGNHLIGSAAESGQKKLARAAYEVFRRVRFFRLKRETVTTLPTWVNLTENEQNEIIGAAGDYLESIL